MTQEVITWFLLCSHSMILISKLWSKEVGLDSRVGINSKEKENIMSFHSYIIIFLVIKERAHSQRVPVFLTQDIQITNLQRKRQKLYDTNTGSVKLGKSFIYRNLLGIKLWDTAECGSFWSWVDLSWVVYSNLGGGLFRTWKVGQFGIMYALLYVYEWTDGQVLSFVK